MLDRHNLSFPVRRNETATSYVSRLTRYCGLASPNDLCLDQGFRWQDLVRGDDVLFEQLARFAGASADDLKRWAVRTMGRHQYEVSGQQATKASLVRTRLRVCPHCLVADRQKWGRHGAYRRHHWQFRSIRNCIVHGAPLISLPSEKYTIHNYDFLGRVEEHWRRIERGLDEPNSKTATEFEHYLAGRLEGLNQNVFLDGMPMFIASRLCEVLGFVLEFGPERKISGASEGELSAAGQAGLEALRTGEDGLYAALDSLVSPNGLRTIRHRSDLGAFFEWLRSSILGAEFDSIKAMVREYIFRTYPCKKGDMVLGETCTTKSKYSIHGAWKELGIQRNRMNRFLIAEGSALKHGGDKTIRLKDGLTSADVGRISNKMANRLTVAETCALLNVSVEFLTQMRCQGIIVPVIDALDQVPKYERDVLVNLLDRLRSKVGEPPSEKAGMTSIIETSRRLRCPASDIVHLVLSDKIEPVSYDDNIVGIAGFQVNLASVRAALPPIEIQGLTKGEATRLLRVTYPTINYFIETRQLNTKRVRNPKSRQFLQAVCADSIDQFQRKYVTLGQLAYRYRRAPGPLGCHLEAKGVCPCETPQGFSWYYERKGLERRLTKAGLRLPETQ